MDVSQQQQISDGDVVFAPYALGDSGLSAHLLREKDPIAREVYEMSSVRYLRVKYRYDGIKLPHSLTDGEIKRAYLSERKAMGIDTGPVPYGAKNHTCCKKYVGFYRTLPVFYNFRHARGAQPHDVFLPVVHPLLDAKKLKAHEDKYGILSRYGNTADWEETYRYLTEEKNDHFFYHVACQARKRKELFMKFILQAQPELVPLCEEAALQVNHPQLYDHLAFVKLLYPERQPNLRSPAYDILDNVKRYEYEFKHFATVLLYVEILNWRVNLYLYLKLRAQLEREANPVAECKVVPVHTAQVLKAYMQKYYLHREIRRFNDFMSTYMWETLVFLGEKVSLARVLYVLTHGLLWVHNEHYVNKFPKMYLSEMPENLNGHMNIKERMELILTLIFGNTKEMYTVGTLL